MVKKLKKTATEKAINHPLTNTIKDSAQQIWLAGLGAFAKAQEEGGRVFEALVKEGLSMQQKTQTATEEKVSEATGRVASMASDLSSKAAGQWDKLETIFEDRVAKALNKLGVPTARDIEALMARIDVLNESVLALNQAQARGKPASKSTAAQAPETPPAPAPEEAQAPAKPKRVRKPSPKKAPATQTTADTEGSAA